MWSKTLKALVLLFVLAGSAQSQLNFSRKFSVDSLKTLNNTTIRVLSPMNFNRYAYMDSIQSNVGGSNVLVNDSLKVSGYIYGDTFESYTGASDITFRDNIVPGSANGFSLGTLALPWSDGFFGDGAVLNFNASNYTITHSADVLTFSDTVKAARGTFGNPSYGDSSLNALGIHARGGKFGGFIEVTGDSSGNILLKNTGPGSYVNPDLQDYMISMKNTELTIEGRGDENAFLGLYASEDSVHNVDYLIYAKGRPDDDSGFVTVPFQRYYMGYAAAAAQWEFGQEGNQPALPIRFYTGYNSNRLAISIDTLAGVVLDSLVVGNAGTGNRGAHFNGEITADDGIVSTALPALTIGSFLVNQGVINSDEGIFINIDADSNYSNRLFQVGHDQADAGGTKYVFKVNEAGLATILDDLVVNGDALTTDETIFNLLNATATTVNAFGAATTLSMGAATGTTTVNNDLLPTGNLVIPMGEISYFDMTGTAVVIAGTSDGSTNMVVVAPATAVSGDEYAFDNGGANNGRLRYTGATTRMFHVAVTLSVSPASANDTFVIGVAKGGTVDASSKILQKVVTSGDTQFGALHVYLSLATNEYIEVYVGNTTDADDITVKTLNIFAMGM